MPDPGNRLQIVLWKWANPNKLHIIFDFSADAVNRLARQLGQHLSIPHDVVCITDNPSGIDSGIRVLPMWEDHAELGGCWRRLRAFAPDMSELIGPRFAWIDLDSVIVGSMDAVLGRSEDLILYRSNSVANTPYNGSMLLMNAGARPQIWDRFDPATSPGLVREAGLTGTDQAWISHILGPDEAVWDASDGVMHFKRDCVPNLPEHARIVFFPGPQKMHLPNARRHAPWIDEQFFATSPGSA
jgi:hypothetical protein